MVRKIKPITFSVVTEKGKKRLAEDIQRKKEIKSAIQKKVPKSEIEAKYNVKFVTPI